MTVNRLRPAALLALLVASVAVAAPITSAEITFPTDSGIFLTDAVGVLNESEKSELNDVADVLESDTGTVLVVVLINSTKNYTSGSDANMSLGDYTARMFDEWQIGDPDYRDGLLIVLATNQSSEGYDWAYTGGDHWLEFWDILSYWDENLDDSVFEQLNESNWMDALNTMMHQLSDEVRDFWDDYYDIEPFDAEDGDWSTSPTLEGADNGEDVYASSLGESLIFLVSCFGCLGVLGLLFFALSRGSSGGSSRGNTQYYPNYNGGGYHPHNGYHPHGGYQQNNYYMGGDAPQNYQTPMPQNQQRSSRTSRGSSSSRSSRSGSSSRSSSSRGSSSSRSSSSSRGSSSSRSSRGGSSSRSSSSRGSSSSRSSGGSSRGGGSSRSGGSSRGGGGRRSGGGRR